MFILTNEYRTAFYNVDTELERDELISRGFIDITEETSVNKNTSTKRGKKNDKKEN
jgi:hypothetical protein